MITIQKNNNMLLFYKGIGIRYENNKGRKK